jgi:Gpi18-like mannosyltransferase
LETAADLYHKLRPSKVWPVVAVFIIWKLIMLSAMTFALIKVHEPGNPINNPPIHSGQLMRATFKWDSYYYLQIAEHDYGKVKTALPVFFPLFPYSVRTVSAALHLGPLAAGYAINTVASFFAMLFMYLLAFEFFRDRRAALQALLLFAFFPFSYFMSAFYTEALFCALSLGAFYFARRRIWGSPGVIVGEVMRRLVRVGV